MDTILIIEDEEDLLITLEYNLKREGYKTQAVSTGEEGLRWALEQGPPDLVLLDIMLPGISGIEVCHHLRANEKTCSTPVLFLSAKGEDIDRVVGFEMGADDYVVKPFNVRELMLRIRSILRRSRQTSHRTKEGSMDFGQLRVDINSHKVWVADQEILLTALEFKLLSLFLTRKGQVQSREILLADVWGINTPVQTRTVDAHVKRLREKLGVMGDAIETLRGVGYRFREQP